MSAMAYGIVLTLGSGLEDRVRCVWRELESSAVGATPAAFGEPPHITLALMPEADPDRLVRIIDCLRFDELAVRLVPFGVFCGEDFTLYYAVAPAPGLAAGSAQLHALLEAEGIGRDPLFAPGSAILHCTLAVEVAAEDLQRGIEVCRRHPETLEGAVAGFELLEFFPVRSLYRRGLGAV